MVFHNPKDLVVAIAAEAGELMQPFVWKSPEQAEQIAIAKKPESTKPLPLCNTINPNRPKSRDRALTQQKFSSRPLALSNDQYAEASIPKGFHSQSDAKSDKCLPVTCSKTKPNNCVEPL